MTRPDGWYGFRNATMKEMAKLAAAGCVTPEAPERLREWRRVRNRERRKARKEKK